MIEDLLAFGGIALVGFGAYQIYPPAALIIVGLSFIAVSIALVRNGPKRR